MTASSAVRLWEIDPRSVFEIAERPVERRRGRSVELDGAGHYDAAIDVIDLNPWDGLSDRNPFPKSIY
ncbi:MAG: hypothetical protein KF711_04375 [Nitrospira sp.]|nr:hypothetical protein [Nitrospira sp.]